MYLHHHQFAHMIVYNAFESAENLTKMSHQILNCENIELHFDLESANIQTPLLSYGISAHDRQTVRLLRTPTLPCIPALQKSWFQNRIQNTVVSIDFVIFHSF